MLAAVGGVVRREDLPVDDDVGDVDPLGAEFAGSKDIAE